MQINIMYFLGRLHNGEHFVLMEKIAGFFKEYIEGMPMLKKDWNRFKNMASHEGKIYRKSLKSLETKEITALNKERILYWREMRRRLKFFEAAGPDKAARKNAGRLLLLVKASNDVLHVNLLERTINLDKILLLLNGEEYREAVDSIPEFRELMEKLARANLEFTGHYRKRAKEIAKNKELGKLVLFRRKMDKALLALLNSMNIVYKYNEMGAKDPDVKQRLEKTAFQMNALINQLKLNLAHRGIHVVQVKKRH